MVIDVLGSEVGVVDLVSMYATRKVGEDIVVLPVTPAGFYQGEINFLHATMDCSGDRLLPNNGYSFVYMGQLSGSTVFYTRLADPNIPPVTVSAYETLAPGDDPAGPRNCQPLPPETDPQAVGKAEQVVDPRIGGLVAPFRLK